PALHCRTPGFRRLTARPECRRRHEEITDPCMQDSPVTIRSQDLLYKQGQITKVPVRTTLGAREESGCYSLASAQVDRAGRKPYASCIQEPITCMPEPAAFDRP